MAASGRSNAAGKCPVPSLIMYVFCLHFSAYDSIADHESVTLWYSSLQDLQEQLTVAKLVRQPLDIFSGPEGSLLHSPKATNGLKI